MAKAKISSLPSSRKIPKASSSKAVPKLNEVAELEKRTEANPEDLNVRLNSGRFGGGQLIVLS